MNADDRAVLTNDVLMLVGKVVQMKAALAYIRATLGPYSEDLTPRDRLKLVENAYLRAVTALRGKDDLL